MPEKKSGKNMQKKLPEEFRKYFWDCEFGKLNMQNYPKFIAERILSFGTLDAVRWLFKHVDREFIRLLVKNSRNLNSKTRNFWILYYND